MKKILFVLESRASYGYAKNLIEIFRQKKTKLRFKTFVTGTHLSKELGSSINDLKKDKIKINYTHRFSHTDIGLGISNITKKTNEILKDFNPHIVFIFGDRIELIGIAVACTYNNFPIAHVQAGDRSGHIDDVTRMTLAKLCHIHFPATEKAKKRLYKLGEDKFRVYKVGAPQLDQINYKKIKKTKFINYNKKRFYLNENYFLVLQHSVFKDKENYRKYFENTIIACLKFNYKIFLIYPNYDPGYKHIIKVIKKYEKKFSNKLIVIKHLHRQEFLSLAANSLCIIGNSSAGILESPSLKIPAINIGDRQEFREQNKNIFNSDYNVNDITKNIKKAIKMKGKFLNIKNVHGDGRSSHRIYDVISKIKIDKKLINKNTVY